jgi:hypothetical protein
MQVMERSSEGDTTMELLLQGLSLGDKDDTRCVAVKLYNAKWEKPWDEGAQGLYQRSLPNGYVKRQINSSAEMNTIVLPSGNKDGCDWFAVEIQGSGIGSEN